MRVTLRARFFLWLLLLLTIFVIVQSAVYAVVEILTLVQHPELDWREQLLEVALGAGLDIVLIPVLAIAAWWISSTMLRPIRALARTASEIGRGEIQRRVDTSAMPDDEMYSLAETLNHAFDQYTETIRRLDRFSSDASHQLRTPLASIRTQAELGLTQERSTAEYQDLLGSILEDVARLSHLVEQLMTMARLDADSRAASFVDFDLTALVRTTVMLYQAACEAEGMRLETCLVDACHITGNADLIREVLRNLLDNALKYAGTGHDVCVELMQDDESTILVVMDNGPGIPDSQAQAIFDRFHQVQPSGMAGSGLGLALAAQIVRVHGGTIVLVDRAGWSTAFEIRLKKS